MQFSENLDRNSEKASETGKDLPIVSFARYFARSNRYFVFQQAVDLFFMKGDSVLQFVPFGSGNFDFLFGILRQNFLAFLGSDAQFVGDRRVETERIQVEKYPSKVANSNELNSSADTDDD